MNTKLINNFIKQTLKEDSSFFDITTRTLIPLDHRAKARIITRQPCVLCGMELAKGIFKYLDKTISVKTRFKDGAILKKGECLATIHGHTRGILSGERSALNILGYMSGIATLTHSYVSAVKSYKTLILDTRKTTPTMRWLEKYAVRCGGGVNHRFNLSDAAMIKDNHLAISSKSLSMAESIKKLRKIKKEIIIEVENLDQLTESLLAHPDIVLLDNMPADQIKKAVLIRNRLNKKVLLEASGGINLKTIQSVARTGVERISVGAITHAAPSIDLSLEMME
ncbi:MAG: carboxylating nicotinate-nucleotide diphosphorylase [Candidatus Omnitrophica bacterium]|nr:carboxylating nicotinate-nucleotide diphosphorylase [Candidatus Omnitrophota bacterium]